MKIINYTSQAVLLSLKGSIKAIIYVNLRIIEQHQYLFANTTFDKKVRMLPTPLA